MKNYYHWLNKIEIAKESVLNCLGHLSKTRILIKGANNCLKIAENTNIVNCDIVVKGSGNSLVFEDDCVADGNYSCLTMWKEEEI